MLITFVFNLKTVFSSNNSRLVYCNQSTNQHLWQVENISISRLTSSCVTSQKQENSSCPVESQEHSDMIVYKPSHHLTVILARKLNTRLHSTVVVACCFDCSPSPLCFITHNYLTCPSIFRPCACKHSQAWSHLTQQDACSIHMLLNTEAETIREPD